MGNVFEGTKIILKNMGVNLGYFSWFSNIFNIYTRVLGLQNNIQPNLFFQLLQLFLTSQKVFQSRLTSFPKVQMLTQVTLACFQIFLILIQMNFLTVVTFSYIIGSVFRWSRGRSIHWIQLLWLILRYFK
jgi:hypothetical protein